MPKKICNKCGFQQNEFLNWGGKSYCKSCNSEINLNSNQISEQKQKSLHKMKVALDTLYNVLEPLEEYVEKTGNYPGFISKRQIYRKTIKDSEGSLENDEDLFLSNLYIFARTFHGKPKFFMEVVQEEFYKWINAVGITADNCREELKHFLIEINNVLDGNDEKIIRETQERNKDVEIDPKMMVEIFAGLQNPLNKNRQQRKELEGKKWNEIPEEDRLKGDADLGKQAFEEIKKSVSIPHQNFRLRYFGEKRSTQQGQVSSSMEGIEWNEDNEMQGLRLEKPVNRANANQPQKNNNNIGTGGIITIASIGVLLIGGVVVLKKRLNKKLKK